MYNSTKKFNIGEKVTFYYKKIGGTYIVPLSHNGNIEIKNMFQL